MPPATERSTKHSAAHKHHGHAAGSMSDIPPTAANAARRVSSSAAPVVTSSGRATKRRRSTTLDADFDYADHGSCSAQEEREDADEDGVGASESEEETSSGGGHKKAGGAGRGGSTNSGGAISSAEAKRRRRQQQNRDAAATSRNRKKAYLTGLERKVASLEAENARLRDELKTQARLIHSLRAPTTTSGPSNHAVVPSIPQPVQVAPFQAAASSPSPVSPSSDGFHSSTPTSPLSRWDSNAHASGSASSRSHSHASSAASSHVASHRSSPTSSRLVPTRRVSPLSLDLDVNPSSLVGEGELHLHLADELPMLTSPLLTKEPSAYQPLAYPVVASAPTAAPVHQSHSQSQHVTHELDQVEAHPHPAHAHSHPLSSHPSSFYSDSSCAVNASPYLSVFGAEYNSLPTHGLVGGAGVVPPFALSAGRFASSCPPHVQSALHTSCPSDRLYVPAVNNALQWQSIVVALWTVMAMAIWRTISDTSSRCTSEMGQARQTTLLSCTPTRELAPLDALDRSLRLLSLASPSCASTSVHFSYSPLSLHQSPPIACT